MAARIKKITKQDLLPGDVLLSCGKNRLSQWIRDIAGGSYSHSGVWDGSFCIDATKKGVKRNPLAYVLEEQEYVDAYRWQPKPDDGHLGDPNYPYQPVLKQADAIVRAGTKFAYDELLMLAFVVAGSRIALGHGLRALIWFALARLDVWIHKILAGGKRTMMCTEVICTSYWQAASDRRYAINILVGADPPARLLLASSQLVGPAAQRFGATATVSADDDLRQECARLLLLAAGPAQRKSLKALAGIRAPSLVGGPVEEPAGGPLVPLGCVTPFDLQGSPSLEPIGRLE